MRVLSLAVLLPALILGTIAAQSGGKQIIQAGAPTNRPFSPGVRSGDFIYLSGTIAADAGDIKAQTKQVVNNLATILKAAGADLSRVAAVTVYLRNLGDFGPMNEVYRTFWPADPPTRTTVIVDNLVQPAGLIEISMVAIRPGAERKVVHPEGWLKTNPYSFGIQSGDTLFLSGMISRNMKDNSNMEGDIKAQTKAVLDNAGVVLKAAGLSYDNVVSSRVFITDRAMFQDMNAVYRTYFPKDPPARATVKALPPAAPLLVEMTMLAMRGPKKAFTTPNPDGSPGTANPVLSSAVMVGNRLFLAGMLGNTDANKGDIKAQTRETLARLGRTMKAAGFDWAHVVDGVVYLPDMANYAGMNDAYRETIPKDFPTRATVGTPLMNADGLVEIMMAAAK